MKNTVVVFSGAGLSAESGLSTFRDANGLWNNHNMMDVAHPDGWKRNPEVVLKFYTKLMYSVKDAKPNEAHYSIARLQTKFNVVNVTQNIDNLLERAGCKDVRHLHGNLFTRKCSNRRCRYEV